MRRCSRISEHVTPCTHLAGSDQPLPVVREHMRQLGLRNLPIVKDGKLCGVLSESDVALVEHLPSEHLAQLSVGAAMGGDLYAVAHSAPLAHVVRTMAEHGYGCAVVLERESVVGLFSASDALRMLSAVLEAESANDAPMDGSELRALVLTEYAHVGALCQRTLRSVERLRGSREPERDARRLQERARHLCEAVRSLLALQEHRLAPALSDLTGSSKTLGEQLREEHGRQATDHAKLASLLEDEQPPGGAPAELEQLLGSLQQDFERAHALLSALDASSNDYVITDAAAD